MGVPYVTPNKAEQITKEVVKEQIPTLVSVSPTGTATDTVSYITIDGVEKKLAGGGGGSYSAGDGIKIENSVISADFTNTDFAKAVANKQYVMDNIHTLNISKDTSGKWQAYDAVTGEIAYDTTTGNFKNNYSLAWIDISDDEWCCAVVSASPNSNQANGMALDNNGRQYNESFIVNIGSDNELILDETANSGASLYINKQSDESYSIIDSLTESSALYEDLKLKKQYNTFRYTQNTDDESLIIFGACATGYDEYGMTCFGTGIDFNSGSIYSIDAYGNEGAIRVDLTNITPSSGGGGACLDIEVAENGTVELFDHESGDSAITDNAFNKNFTTCYYFAQNEEYIYGQGTVILSNNRTASCVVASESTGRRYCLDITINDTTGVITLDKTRFSDDDNGLKIYKDTSGTIQCVDYYTNNTVFTNYSGIEQFIKFYSTFYLMVDDLDVRGACTCHNTSAGAEFEGVGIDETTGKKYLVKRESGTVTYKELDGSPCIYGTNYTESGGWELANYNTGESAITSDRKFDKYYTTCCLFDYDLYDIVEGVISVDDDKTGASGFVTHAATGRTYYITISIDESDISITGLDESGAIGDDDNVLVIKYDASASTYLYCDYYQSSFQPISTSRKGFTKRYTTLYFFNQSTSVLGIGNCICVNNTTGLGILKGMFTNPETGKSYFISMTQAEDLSLATTVTEIGGSSGGGGTEIPCTLTVSSEQATATASGTYSPAQLLAMYTNYISGTVYYVKDADPTTSGTAHRCIIDSMYIDYSTNSATLCCSFCAWFGSGGVVQGKMIINT